LIKKFIILLLQICAIVGLFFSIDKISIENNIWLKDSHPTKLNKTHLEHEFNVKEATLISVKLKDNFFRQKYIKELREVTTKLEKIEIPTLDIKTPLNVDVVINKKNTLDILTYDNALSKKLISLEEYEQRFINSVYNLQLVSKSNKEFAILIGVSKKFAKSNNRDYLLKEIRDILDKSIYFKNYSLAGSTPLLVEIDKKNLRAIKLALLIAFIAFFILLIIVYRDIVKIFIISISAISAVLISINVIVYLHATLNSINIIIPIVAITIAVGDSIHILSRFELLEDSKDRIKNTFMQTIKPCFLTSFTSMVGFGSFYFSQIVPLNNFSIESVFSIIAIFIFSVLGTFVNLYIFEERLKRKRAIKEPKLLIFINFVIVRKYYKYVVLFTVVIILFFSYALKNSTSETNFLNVFFKPYEKIYQNFIFFDNHFNGTGNFDILFHGDKNEFKSIEWFDKIIKIEDVLKSNQTVVDAKSYADYISMVHKEVLNKQYPRIQEDLEQELLFIELSQSASKNDMLSSYTNFDYSEVRLNIKTPNLNSIETKKIIDFIKKTLYDNNVSNYTLTGNEYFIFSLGEYVLDTQIQSIVICLIFISILFMFLYGVKLSILASMTNFLPILVTLGALVSLGNSFDFATVAIAGVAIGFCVDDTIHMVHTFKEQKTSSQRLAILRSIRLMYRPLMLTTIILGICFFSFFLTDMVISQKFGLFSSLAIVLAFVADMLILPSFIFFFKKIVSKS
jgi:predicted RND superfamily exporter protein